MSAQITPSEALSVIAQALIAMRNAHLERNKATEALLEPIPAPPTLEEIRSIRQSLKTVERSGSTPVDERTTFLEEIRQSRAALRQVPINPPQRNTNRSEFEEALMQIRSRVLVDTSDESYDSSDDESSEW